MEYIPDLLTFFLRKSIIIIDLNGRKVETFKLYNRVAIENTSKIVGRIWKK